MQERISGPNTGAVPPIWWGVWSGLLGVGVGWLLAHLPKTQP